MLLLFCTTYPCLKAYPIFLGFSFLLSVPWEIPTFFEIVSSYFSLWNCLCDFFCQFQVIVFYFLGIFKYQELRNKAAFPGISVCVCLAGSKLCSETFIQLQEHQTYKHSSHGGRSPVLHDLLSYSCSKQFLLPGSSWLFQLCYAWIHSFLIILLAVFSSFKCCTFLVLDYFLLSLYNISLTFCTVDHLVLLKPSPFSPVYWLSF